MISPVPEGTDPVPLPDHWDVDHGAPSYYPTQGEYHEAIVTPDTPLIATQRLLRDHPAFHHFDLTKVAAPEIPEIVAMGGQADINDGHHRLAAAHRAGVPVPVRVWSDPEEDY